MELEAGVKNRARWLMFAALLSLVNIAMGAGQMYGFNVVGLGSSTVLMLLVNRLSPGNMMGLVLGFIPLVVFVVLGNQASKRQLWAFYVGIALYALDGVLLLSFEAFKAVAVHGFVLFKLYQGIALVHEYNDVDAAEARSLRYVAVPGQPLEWNAPQATQGAETWPPAPAVSIDAPNLGWASQPTAPASARQPGALPVDWARRLDPVPLPVSQPTDWANQPGGVIPPAQANPAAQRVSAADWANIPGGPTQPSLPQSGTQKWPPPRS